MLEDLWVEPGGFFAYHPSATVNIHNANLLGALCVHLGSATIRWPAIGHGQRSGAPSLRRKRDGGFPYGDGAGLQWRDSFHTGFVLRCLMEMESLDPAVGDAVRRGATAYLRFFDRDGRARLWADREYPEDAHSAGTGLSTLALLCRRDRLIRRCYARVARTDRHGRPTKRARRDPPVPVGATTTRYLRWCDAHVALGLADAAEALSS